MADGILMVHSPKTIYSEDNLENRTDKKPQKINVDTRRGLGRQGVGVANSTKDERWGNLKN
jgi:hypothetical protein